MTSNHVSRPINSGRSNAMTPKLSVTNRTLCVVRNSTSGTGQSVPFSTTSMRQTCPGAPIPAATREEQAKAETRKTRLCWHEDALSRGIHEFIIGYPNVSAAFAVDQFLILFDRIQFDKGSRV